MNKKTAIPLIISALYLLSACNGVGGSSNSTNSSSQTSGEGENVTMNYEDFYQGDFSKVPEKTGQSLYMASDGYRSSRIQGYNHFYYEILEANEFKRIELANNEFLNDGVGCSDSLMSSKDGQSATRLFQAPIGGEVTIKNSIYLVSGDFAQIIVYHNSKVLADKTISSESTYFEVAANLIVNDNLRFVVIGDATVRYNPIIDYVNGPEESLHTTCDGYYGDVHPYYNQEDKKIYMFYLSTGNQSVNRTAQFQSMLTTSTDMIRYQNEECKINDDRRPLQDLYFVLNVFKDKEGRYRSSQGGNLTTVSSISSDLHIWENGSLPYMDDEGNLTWTYNSPFGDGVYSGRDPDTFYDKDSDKYYTVVINYFTSLGANGEKHLVLYIGNNEGHYSKETHKVLNFTSKGDPECPQIKKIGNRWYLFYSVYGTGANGNVGRMAYRVGPENTLPQDVNWNAIQEQYIDGTDVHAAQIFNIGDKMYVYGWIHYQFNTNVWGGYLNLPHEVYVDETDGSLNARLDEKLISLLDKGLVYENPSITSETELGEVYRNLIKATITENAAFQVRGYKIWVANDGFKTYLNCAGGAYSNRIEVKPADEYEMTISLDGAIWDICVNDSRVMTCHTDVVFPSKLTALVENQGQIKDLKISKLADLNNIYY